MGHEDKKVQSLDRSWSTVDQVSAPTGTHRDATLAGPQYGTPRTRHNETPMSTPANSLPTCHDDRSGGLDPPMDPHVASTEAPAAASQQVNDASQPHPSESRRSEPLQSKPRRALLVVNPKAGRRDELSEGWTKQVEQSGIKLLPAEPAEGESLSELIVRRASEVDLVILAGGDGTLNDAVDGLIETKLPLGVLPLGTANDLARTLDLPTDLDEACRVITDGHLRRIDLGQVNGKHFFNVASMGLSVTITRSLTKDVKKLWGVLAYLATATKATFYARPFRAEIDDGKTVFHVKTVQIAVGNGKHYGGGMTICDDASIDDQLLDLYSLEVRHWWQVVLLFPRLRMGMLEGSSHVRTMRGKSFKITTKRRRRINTDGELTTRTPADFRVAPLALSVFTPSHCE